MKYMICYPEVIQVLIPKTVILFSELSKITAKDIPWISFLKIE